MSIDLKGNTNYTALRGLPTLDPTTSAVVPGPYIVPRTALSAVDLIVTGGLTCSGDTLSLDIATSSDIEAGTDDKVITADVLKPYLDTMQTTLVEGTGIDITNGTVSVSDIPQEDVTGLSASLAAKQDTISAGYRMEIVSGTTVAQQRYFDIETPAAGSTITLQAGHAYNIRITTAAGAVTLVSEPENVANKFGLEGHAEIFVANTGYLHTDGSVVFASPLMPNAMNNCTLRFHDGECIISLEDHLYGYIVVQNDNTGEGSLYYALTNASLASQEYIAVSELLAGQTLALANANVTNNKHLIGNGYDDTIIGGTVSVAANKTFKVDAVGLDNVTVTSGTLTLTDAYIPSGVTVAVSGGRLAVEKVTGNGGVIDLGGTRIAVKTTTATLRGCTITGGQRLEVISNGVAIIDSCRIYGNTVAQDGAVGGAIAVNDSSAKVTVANCIISGNSVSGAGGGVGVTNGSAMIISSLISGNSASWLDAYDIAAYLNGKLTISGSTVGEVGLRGGSCMLAGENSILKSVKSYGGTSGTVTITSGAILDLTGNTNTTPIAPGGGITFESGGATVLYSSGAVSGSYMMDNVTLPAGAKLTNTAVVDLGLSTTAIPSGATATASGVTFTGGSGNQVISANSNSVATFTDCIFSGLGGRVEKGISANIIMSGCSVIDNKLADALVTGPITTFRGSGAIVMTDCYFSGNDGRYAINALQCLSGGVANLNGGNTFESGQNIAFNNGGGYVTMAGSNHFLASCFGIGGGSGSGSVTLTSGAILDLTGNTNATPINPGGTVTFDVEGATVKYSGGKYSLSNFVVPYLTNSNGINFSGTGHVVESGITGNQKAVNYTLISGNVGGDAGGCIKLANTAVGGSITFASCTFSHGEAYGAGGGVYISGTTANFGPVSIVDNHTNNNGGGICVDPGTVVSCNSTVIIRNSAGSAGGGIYIASGATATLGSGTFVMSNTASAGNDIYLDSTAVLRFSGGSADKVYLGSSGARVDILSGSEHADSNWIGLMSGAAGMYAGVVIEAGASMYIANKIETNGPISVPTGTVSINGSDCTFAGGQISYIRNNNGTIQWA